MNHDSILIFWEGFRAWTVLYGLGAVGYRSTSLGEFPTAVHPFKAP